VDRYDKSQIARARILSAQDNMFITVENPIATYNKLLHPTLRLLVIIFCFVPAIVYSNGPDLMRIEYVPPKARVQDNVSEMKPPVIEELLAMGNESIPFLISRLSSERSYREPPLDYYPHLTEGDMAYIILNDFFTSANGEKTSVPALYWNALLETSKHPNTPAWDVLDIYHQTHNQDELRRKWNDMWQRNGKQIVWDKSQNFFRIQGSPLVNCK
jgi:hypothetical protein